MLCRFCQRDCKNSNSHRNHERLCKYNPERQTTLFSDIEFQRNKIGNGGENQHTKAKRLGLPKPLVKEETKQKIRISNSRRDKAWHIENGLRIQKAVNEKVKNGEWHSSLAKNMHISYKGVDLHGTWELKYAIFLDENGVQWERNKNSFPYSYEGKERRYTPDFYLPETDEYVEIKGYKTEKDDAKWLQFPEDKKLKILMKEDLLTLGLKI